MENNLKYYRNKTSLSQDAVGKAMGLDRVTVANHENGKYDISFKKHLVRYAELYNCEPADLITNLNKLGEKNSTFIAPQLSENITMEAMEIAREVLKDHLKRDPEPSLVRKVTEKTINSLKQMNRKEVTASLVKYIIEVENI